MARPAYKKDQKTAKERIKEMFWEMLRETPYEKITVKELVKRAGVNPNTFYYHYETMDDLAVQLFEENKLREVPDAIHAGIIQGEHIDLGALMSGIVKHERWRNLRLYAKEDSPFLRQYFMKAIAQTWLDVLGISESDLTPTQKLDFRFIISGVTALVAQQLEEETPELLYTITDRPIGKGIVQTLEEMQKRNTL